MAHLAVPLKLNGSKLTQPRQTAFESITLLDWNDKKERVTKKPHSGAACEEMKDRSQTHT